MQFPNPKKPFGYRLTGSAGVISPAPVAGGMEGKKRLAYSLLCAGVAFVGVFHFVLSSVYGYGLRQVSALLVAAALFGLLLVNA